MKNILSVALLVILSGCGMDLAEIAKDEAMLRELSRIDGRLIPQECEETNSCLPKLERLDFNDVERVEEGRLTQIDPVPRPEFTNIIICHKNRKTKKVDYIEWLDHREHGDTIGACRLVPHLP